MAVAEFLVYPDLFDATVLQIVNDLRPVLLIPVDPAGCEQDGRIVDSLTWRERYLRMRDYDMQSKGPNIGIESQAGTPVLTAKCLGYRHLRNSG